MLKNISKNLLKDAVPFIPNCSRIFLPILALVSSAHGGLFEKLTKQGKEALQGQKNVVPAETAAASTTTSTATAAATATTTATAATSTALKPVESKRPSGKGHNNGEEPQRSLNSTTPKTLSPLQCAESAARPTRTSSRTGEQVSVFARYPIPHGLREQDHQRHQHGPPRVPLDGGRGVQGQGTA